MIYEINNFIQNNKARGSNVRFATFQQSMIHDVHLGLGNDSMEKKRFHIVEGTQSNLSRITSKVTSNDLLRSAIIVKNRGKYQLKIAFLSIAS